MPGNQPADEPERPDHANEAADPDANNDELPDPDAITEADPAASDETGNTRAIENESTTTRHDAIEPAAGGGETVGTVPEGAVNGLFGSINLSDWDGGRGHAMTSAIQFGKSDISCRTQSRGEADDQTMTGPPARAGRSGRSDRRPGR